MEIHGMDAIIKDHPFFKGLAEKYIALLAGCATNARYNGGDYCFKSGEPADKFYIIREGKVALETWSPERGAITIQTFGNGDVFDWSWLFPPYRCYLSARAAELTRVFAMDAKCLREKIEKDHDLGYEMMKRFSTIMIDRLEATRIQLLDVYKSTPP